MKNNTKPMHNTQLVTQITINRVIACVCVACALKNNNVKEHDL